MVKLMQETQNVPIAAELYQQTLEKLDLQTVCLDEIKACCDREAAQEGQVEISLSADTEARQTDSQYFAFITYRLRGERGGDMLLEVDARYRLIFDTEVQVPEGFFEVFRDLNLRITTMPYFRELVASLTGRMDIPTLTLPYSIYAAPSIEIEEQEAVSVATDDVPKKTGTQATLN